MLSESDKSADHEMCSSDRGRFHCVRFASDRSVTTALSSESGAAIWRRSDRDRKGFDPTFYKTSACYSAKVRAVSAVRRRQSRLRDRSFLTSILSARCCKISLSGKLFLNANHSVVSVTVEFCRSQGGYPPIYICARIATQ